MRENIPELISIRELIEGLRKIQEYDECLKREFWISVSEGFNNFVSRPNRTPCCEALIDEGKCCKCRRAIEDPPIR